MKPREACIVAIGALFAACAGAAASQRESSVVTSELPADTLMDDDAGVHFHQEAIPDYTIGGLGADGGGNEQVITPRAGDGGRIAVSADAGVVSGELAWLVSHIGDTPDRLRSDDSDNVRQIAAHGADGVRAVAQVFERGDAARTPFARRVVERLIMRICHQRDRSDAQALGAWIELGDDAPSVAPDGLMHWSRPADAAWPPDAVRRLRSWADAGMPCTMTGERSPAPSSSGSPAPAHGATDAGTHHAP